MQFSLDMAGEPCLQPGELSKIKDSPSSSHVSSNSRTEIQKSVFVLNEQTNFRTTTWQKGIKDQQTSDSQKCPPTITRKSKEATHKVGLVLKERPTWPEEASGDPR